MKNKVHVVLFALLVAWQGGYSDMAWCVFGLLLAVYLCLRMERLPPLPLVLAMLGIFASAVISTIYNESGADSLAGLARIIVILLAMCAFSNCKIDTDTVIYWLGLFVGVTSIAVFCGILPIPGQMLNGRVQGLFQYANATGLFLAVVAFKARTSDRSALLAIFAEVALVLTLSVGSIAVFLFAWAVCLFKAEAQTRTERSQTRVTVVLEVILSALTAGAMLAIVRLTGISFLALVPLALRLALERKLQALVAKLSRFAAIFPSAVALVIAGVAGIFILRGFRPLATVIERIIQSSDGLRTLLANPLGLAPGTWELHHTEYQTASYSATKIHNSIVQIGVDYGAIALILLIGIVVWWFAKRTRGANSIAVGMILLHSLFDFSLSFLSIVLLLALLMKDSLTEIKQVKFTKAWRFALAIPICLCLLIVLQSATLNRAQWLGNSGDYIGAKALYTSPLICYNTNGQVQQLRLAIDYSDASEAEETFARIKRPNAEALRLLARIHLASENYELAAEKILASIELSQFSQYGYTLWNNIYPLLNPTLQFYYELQIEYSRRAAQAREHPLFTYIALYQAIHDKATHTPN
jgi:hypothetical protein